MSDCSLTITNNGGFYKLSSELSAIQITCKDLYGVLDAYDKDGVKGLSSTEIENFLTAQNQTIPSNKSYDVTADVTLDGATNITFVENTLVTPVADLTVYPDCTETETEIINYLWTGLSRTGEPKEAFIAAVKTLLNGMNDAVKANDKKTMMEKLNTFIKTECGDNKNSFKFTNAAFNAFFEKKGTDELFSAENGFYNLIVSTDTFGIGLVDYAESKSFNILTPDSPLYKFTMSGIDQFINKTIKDIKITITKDDLKGITGGEALWEQLTTDGAIDKTTGQVLDNEKLDKAVEELNGKGEDEKKLAAKLKAIKYKAIYDNLYKKTLDPSISMTDDENKLLEMLAFAYCDMTGDQGYKDYAEKFQSDMAANGIKDFDLKEEEDVQKFESCLVGNVLNDIREDIVNHTKAANRSDNAFEYLKMLDSKTKRHPEDEGSFAQEIDRTLSTGSDFNKKMAFGGNEVVDKNEKSDDKSGSTVVTPSK